MSIYNQFKTNRDCEENGIFIRFAPNDDKTIPGFRVGRACKSNRAWVAAFEAAKRKNKAVIADGSITEDEARLLNIEVFCKSLLISWENIKDSDGKNIAFSVENAINLFLELPELFDVLQAKAFDFSNFLDADLRADEKN